MSTVKATNFQHPSSAAANITLGSDGSVVLPAGFTGGIGTNVVQTVKTDSFSATAASFTAVTGLTVTITPSSASSKILVLVSVSASSSNTSVSDAYRLTRGGSGIALADAAGSRSLATFRGATYLGGQVHYSYLDSPATTSATTYAIEVLAGLGAAARVNIAHDDVDAADGYRARTTSTITAIEVAA